MLPGSSRGNTLPTPDPYMRRLLHNLQPILVTNRAPLSLQRGDAARGTPDRLVRGAGGLVTAMTSLATATDAVWVANVRNDEDRELAGRDPSGGPTVLTADDGTRYRVAFVDPGAEAYHLFYNVISNPLMWFIQHYLWDLAREPIVDASTSHAWREGYEHVNRMLAGRVVEIARESDLPPLVLIQDYQLYCVPQLIREALPEARLQQFIHIPWPTPHYWTILPKKIRDTILHGLLSNDIVGFQTRRDVRNFLMTCEENLGLGVDFRERTVFHGGRAVWVRNYPISIDVEGLVQRSQGPEVAEEERKIAEWRPRHLILRVDRTDLSKNIVRGFLAYERMLESHPELHGEVQFWAFLQESRQDVDDYRAYLGSVLSVAARVNRRFSGGRWTPIRVEIDDNFDRAIAGYRCFDVLLVNPIYDGMNLVAKEGLICNQRNGVLVLSENAGSHEELGDLAITINPFDIDETAEAIYLGLIMDEREKAARSERIRETVRTNDLTRWLANQLQDLRDLFPG